MTALLAAAGPPSAELPAEAAHRVLNTVRARDAELSKGFRLSGELANVAHFVHLDQGIARRHVVLTGDGKSMGRVEDFFYDNFPDYKPPGTLRYVSTEFDDEGNLTVWRTQFLRALRGPYINHAFEGQVAYVLNPSGEVIEAGENLELTRYQTTDNQTRNQFERVLWGVGRGLAPYLKRAESAEALDGGLVRVKVEGIFGLTSMQGHWQITVDPDNDHLIRSAEFYRGDETVPRMTVETSGVVRAQPTPGAPESAQKRLAVAASGRVSFRVTSDFTFDVDVKCHELKLEADRDLLETLLEELNARVPPDVTVWDHRQGAETPEVYQPRVIDTETMPQ
ncbi:MAG: hypothetical protein ACYS0D_07020 [Planctomycetota bacterium]|jgi:hypothetical protein